MNETRAQAFVSFTSADKEAALRVAASLGRAGFNVWHMKTGTSVGDDWQDEYERRLLRAHAMVAIVSKAYLGQEQCRNEARRAHKKFTQKRMLVAPVVVEPIDPDSLDADSELMLERLLDHGGLADGRPPSDTELDAFAESLALQVRDKGVWPKGSFEGMPEGPTPDETRAQVKRPPEEASSTARPFTEHWSPSGTRVTLELNDGAPGAKAIREWFLERRMRSVNGRVWTFNRETYETVVKDALVGLVSAALKERSHGQDPA